MIPLLFVDRDGELARDVPRHVAHDLTHDLVVDAAAHAFDAGRCP